MYDTIKSYIEFVEQTKRLINIKPVTYFAVNNKEFTTEYPKLYDTLKLWYKKIMHKDPNIRSCMTFVDTFMDLYNLKIQTVMEQLQIKHKLNSKHPQSPFKIDGQYYGRNNPKLTNEICEKILQKYGESAFEYYDKDWRSREKAVIKEGKITAENLKEHFEVIPAELEEKMADNVDLNSKTHKQLTQMIKEMRASGKKVKVNGNSKQALIEAINDNTDS